jgi:hypothetical protein
LQGEKITLAGLVMQKQQSLAFFSPSFLVGILRIWLPT